MARVDLFPAQVPIGRASFNGVEVPVYAKPELLRALRAVQASVNAVESGLAASEIINVPAGGIAATNVQDALNELDTEKEAAGTAAAAIVAHVALADPHTQYTTAAELATGLATKQDADADLTAWAGKTAPGGVVVGDTDAQTLTNKTLTAPAITGGTVDNAPIGATTPNTGKFSSVESTSYVKSGSTTVASLPAAGTAGAGARHFVTDATATTFLSTVAGGGANKVPVVSDGTNWLIG